MDESLIPTNPSFEEPVMQGDEPKNQKPQLGVKKCKSKNKKRVKENVHEKPKQKYYPPHRRRKKKEEGCMAWMIKISWGPKMANGDARDPSWKHPLGFYGVGGRAKRT